ncbi:MAG: cation diffusion facilitator family transporter [Micropepsaceae bacterium]
MAGGHSHDHSHGDGHAHGRSANARQLTLALALTVTFLGVEVAAGFYFGSLALISDAAHMFTDAAALAIALLAIRIGQMPADNLRTYGYRRFEIIAAAVNAVMLFIVGIYILVEGIGRIFDPVPVQSTGMLIVAVVGLAVNFVAMRLLSAGKDESMNVRGAYLEVWADMLGSLGVIIGAVVIALSGQTWVDPVVAIAIGLWVLPRTWTLLRDTTNILLEGAPSNLDLAELRRAVSAVEGAGNVHDLHVWVSGADQASCSLHVELAPQADPDRVRAAACRVLKEQFQIAHATVQTERDPCGERSALHP